MKNRLDISDQTAISMPMKNLIAIISAVAVGVWAYFGILERIKWHIITSENAEEVFAKLEAEGIDPVLFGLTDKDFQLIAKNFAQIRNQLKVTNELLDKYKEYYEGDLENEDEK